MNLEFPGKISFILMHWDFTTFRHVFWSNSNRNSPSKSPKSNDKKRAQKCSPPTAPSIRSTSKTSPKSKSTASASAFEHEKKGKKRIATPNGNGVVECNSEHKEKDSDHLNGRKIPKDVRIAVIGNVDSGKSTMIGVLTSGEFDDGRGSARSRILRHDHEQSNGRTSC